jgi:farnesyl diphosphate synthase
LNIIDSLSILSPSMRNMSSGDTGPLFARQLETWQARIEAQLDLRLPDAMTVPTRLHEALRYCVLGGGKRVRPVLVYATADALGIDPAWVDAPAAAVELIHAYSLVHDDLPAMDDDDLRRGRPTCHKAYDEATAILVGDALQVLAFQILASGPGLPPSPQSRLRLIELLALASGTSGMAGGQALDLAAQGKQLSAAEVEDMHNRKTGALIHAAVMMAAHCPQDPDPTITGALERYALDIGLAFQIQDDLLDIEGDMALLGKATGADSARDKPTYPSVVGTEQARAKLQALHTSALTALSPLGPRAQRLEAVSAWLVGRKF